MGALLQTFLAGVAAASAVKRSQSDRRLRRLRRAVSWGLLVLACPASVIPQLTVERTVFVSATGTPEENCAALRGVLDSIPDPRTLANAYLVKVGPGRYECGTDTVSVPGLVAVEGAGNRATQILGNRASNSLGVVDFDDAASAELRFLTVNNTSPTPSAIAVSAFNSFVLLNTVHLLSSAVPTPVALWVGTDSVAGVGSGTDVRNSLVQGAKTKLIFGGNIAVISFNSTEIEGAPPDTSEGGAVLCSVSFSCGTESCSTLYFNSFPPGPSVPLDSSCSPAPPP